MLMPSGTRKACTAKEGPEVASRLYPLHTMPRGPDDDEDVRSDPLDGAERANYTASGDDEGVALGMTLGVGVPLGDGGMVVVALLEVVGVGVEMEEEPLLCVGVRVKLTVEVGVRVGVAVHVAVPVAVAEEEDVAVATAEVNERALGVARALLLPVADAALDDDADDVAFDVVVAFEEGEKNRRRR